jgi:hypothetical protein
VINESVAVIYNPRTARISQRFRCFGVMVMRPKAGLRGDGQARWLFFRCI